MKKTTFAIAVLVLGFLSSFAHAQSGGLEPLTTFVYHTSCLADSSTWFYNEELEEYDHSTTMTDALVNASVMPGSWLFETTIVASFHFEQDYVGDISIYRSYYSEDYHSPEGHIIDRENTYTKTGISVQAGAQVTWQLGQYFDYTGAWDGSAGHHRDMTAYVQMLNPEIAGYLTIDVIRVKQFDGGQYCYVH